ncbi:hypothetical protein [Bradyrhizobium sp. HKCCYLS20291]|uniref:hypothetical protein n=1 Tax=Bradyrhizobium sp. HKCCYLS20291 TaxID=3420766 RepID=UPI003EBAB42A
MEFADNGRVDHPVFESLKKIRAARSRLQQLTSGRATRAELALQIALYDGLLAELQTISGSLEKRPEARSVVTRRPVATRRHRGTAHLQIVRPSIPRRTKQRK